MQILKRILQSLAVIIIAGAIIVIPYELGKVFAQFDPISPTRGDLEPTILWFKGIHALLCIAVAIALAYVLFAWVRWIITGSFKL